MAEAFRRRDTSTIPRRLRHEGVEKRRQLLRASEFAVAQAIADVASWDRKIAELVERSRGALPQREAMDDLKAHRERALFAKAQRDAELSGAQAALSKALESAPKPEQIAAWQAELEAGLEERRRAAELLADPKFLTRILEIRFALGEPIGLGSLKAEVEDQNAHAGRILRRYVEGNTLGKNWWMPGIEEGEADV